MTKTRDLLSWDNGNGEQEEPLVCLNGHDGGCEGPVEYRYPLSGTGKSYPRCEKHWADRLDVQAGIDSRYPDSPFPPAGFDPTYAGESWNEEE